MSLTQEQKEGLGLAFCEANLLALELDTARRTVGATLAVLSLPPSGEPMPQDRRLSIVLAPVGRVAVRLTEGRRGDPNVRLLPVEPEDLLAVVQSFGGLPTYASECIDVDDPQKSDDWRTTSMDWRSGQDGTSHFVEWFQDGPDRVLVVRVWFDRITIRGPDRAELSVDEVIAGGRRWWAAFRDRDPRTQGYGLFPA
jgi:hypothetical protein